MGSGHQACDHALLASSSQRRVASSVQPGTAKRAPGAVKPWLGRTTTCRGLERCTVAALAEAHRVINRPRVKMERIALLRWGIAQGPSVDHVRTGGHSPKQ